MAPPLAVLMSAVMTFVVQNGSQTLVNRIDFPYDEPENPSVASTYFGGIVVVWDVPSKDKIYGQRFDQDGTRTESPFLIGEGTNCRKPVVTDLPDGAFVVVWETMVDNKWVFNLSAYDESLYDQRISDPLGLPEGVTGHSPAIIQSLRGFKIVYLQRNESSPPGREYSIVSRSFFYSDYTIYKTSDDPVILSAGDNRYIPTDDAVPKVSQVWDELLFGYTWGTETGSVVRLRNEWGEVDSAMHIPGAKTPDMSHDVIAFEKDGDIFVQLLSDKLTDSESPVSVTEGVTGTHHSPKVSLVSKHEGESLIIVIWTRIADTSKPHDTEIMLRRFNVSLIPFLDEISVSGSGGHQQMARVASWGNIFDKGPPSYVILWRSEREIEGSTRGVIAARFFPVILPPTIAPTASPATEIPISTRSPESKIRPSLEDDQQLYEITVVAEGVSFLEAANAVAPLADVFQTLLLHGTQPIFIGSICLNTSALSDCTTPPNQSERTTLRMTFIGASSHHLHWLQTTLASHLDVAMRDCFQTNQNNVVTSTQIINITPVTLSTTSKIGIIIVGCTIVLVICIIAGYCYTKHEERTHMKLQEEGEGEGDQGEDEFEAQNKELEVIHEYEG